MKEEEIIIWEYIENIQTHEPLRMQPYVIKGFTIQKGKRHSVIRLAWFNGSSFDDCDDMIVKTYAAINW